MTHLGLTARQREIMRRRALGDTNEAVAHALNISAQTVKNHVTIVYAKTGATCFAEALIALGWLTVPEPAQEIAA